MDILGGCHCGNISYTVNWSGIPDVIAVRACGCTFCQKHGGVWTSHPEAALEATCTDASALKKYQFGTGTADFYVCSTCGVAPFVVSEIEGRSYAVVNVNTFENVDRSSLAQSSSDFDGEDVGSRLGRRKRNWMSTVRVVEGPV